MNASFKNMAVALIIMSAPIAVQAKQWSLQDCISYACLLYTSRMEYDEMTKTYHARLFMKQGYYSYQYLMKMDQDYLPEDYLSLQQDQLQNSITQEFTFKSCLLYTSRCV